ncbi:hypothetical protein [Microbacterium laevaniformans]|uniref:hypothetical protein n=1 Tax=Microbacterium laevaniformans TaxID=36807 RepID=UPI003D99D0B3
MTVTFNQPVTPDTTLAAQQTLLAAWIRERQDAFAGADGPHVHPVVRPAIVWAAAQTDLDDQPIRTALRRADVPVPDRRQFAQIASGARRYVAERALSDSPAARADARWKVARRGVGRLLSPTPIRVVWAKNDGGEDIQVERPVVSARRMVTARRALAIIVLELLAEIDAGRVGRAVSIQRLAVQLGVKEDTARAAVRTLVQLGWIHRFKGTKRSKGKVGVYVLLVLDAAGEATADAHHATVDALADGAADTDPVADVVTAARQPG